LKLCCALWISNGATILVSFKSVLEIAKAFPWRVPYENLGTVELGGQTGNVGKEIYGSGESLWM